LNNKCNNFEIKLQLNKIGKRNKADYQQMASSVWNGQTFQSCSF